MIWRLAVLSLLFSSVGLMAQVQPTALLQMKVADEQGRSIVGATVQVHALSAPGKTDTAGFVQLRLKPGRYHIHVLANGYEAYHLDIVLEGDAQRELAITMRKALIELRNLVVEESQTSRSDRNQSQTVMALSKEMMDKQGQMTFAKMLEAMPGLTTINTGLTVSKPMIRGLGFNRVVVAENGIKQEGQQWGGDHGLEIDALSVERVELVKGPASLLFGSDALGGVISIRPGALPEKNTFSAQYQAIYRSVNDYLGHHVGVSLNKNNYIFKLRYSHIDYADYKVPADTFIYNTYKLALVNRRLKNTAGQERHLQTMLGVVKSWGTTTLTLSHFNQKVGMFSGSHGIPRSYLLFDDGDPRNVDLPFQKVDHYKAISNTLVHLRKGWLEADFGYQFNQRREHSFPHAHGVPLLEEGNVELAFFLQTVSSNIRWHYNTHKDYQWILGQQSSWQHNTIGGFRYLIPAYEQWQSGLFALLSKEQNRQLSWNAGARMDYGHLHARRRMGWTYVNKQPVQPIQISPEVQQVFLNPSAGAGVSWFLNPKINLKANIGTSFRTPTAPELASNGIHHGAMRHEMGDSTLGSERGLQSDLALVVEDKMYSLHITPFFNYFHQFIFLDPQPEFSPLPEAGLLYQYNQANAVHWGGELFFDFHPIDALHIKTIGQYVYAWNIETNYYLPFTPPASTRLELEYEWEKIGKRLGETYLGLGWQWTAAQNRVARNEWTTPGFHLWNVQAGSNLKLGKTLIQLSVQVHNLLNTKYFAHLNRYRILHLPEAGRNVQVSLRIPVNAVLKDKKP